MSKDANIQTKSDALKSEFDAALPERLQTKERKMGEFSDYFLNQGIRKGKEEGKEEGKAEALLSLMNKLQWTMEQAFDALSIPKGEWEDYRKLVNEMTTQPT